MCAVGSRTQNIIEGIRNQEYPNTQNPHGAF